jgi:hypothetical protein
MTVRAGKLSFPAIDAELRGAGGGVKGRREATSGASTALTPPNASGIDPADHSRPCSSEAKTMVDWLYEDRSAANDEERLTHR